VAHGADVNAAFQGHYPILFAACETLEPVTMRWLLDHGADPDCGDAARWFDRGIPHPGTASDYVAGSYARETDRLRACIDLLLASGGSSKHKESAVWSVVRGRISELAELLDADRSLISRRFSGLDFGTTGSRMLTLRGTTLLHVAAEYQNLEVVQFLVERGADVNAPAEVDAAGVGGQSPIFHAATQPEDGGLAVVRYLVEHGAHLTMRVKLPGHYERPGEIVECTPLEYALLFPGSQGATSAFLRERAPKV
jgi:ankyrin repeat protein